MENKAYQWLPVRAFVLESKLMEVFGVIALDKYFKNEMPPLDSVLIFIEKELETAKCEQLSEEEIELITNKYNVTTKEFL